MSTPWASTSKPCPVCGQRFRVKGSNIRVMDVADAVYRVHLRIDHSCAARIRAAMSRFMAHQRALLGVPVDDEVTR